MALLQAACDCWMFLMGWIWYWRAAAGVAHVGMVDLPLQRCPACLSKEVSSCRVVVEAHMQTVLLCGGLAHKTKQMAHPLAVA